MVVLRDNGHHVSHKKMSSTMALVASRKSAASKNSASACSHQYESTAASHHTEYAIKRRSNTTSSNFYSAAMAQALPARIKGPRTSWGKPHSNHALFVYSSLFVKEEAVASSTSACDDDCIGAGSTSCNMLNTVLNSTCEANSSFVKTEPLQHLAAVIKLEEAVESHDDNNDDEPLHQVPTFFPAMEHLLSHIPSYIPRTRTATAGELLQEEHLPRSAACAYNFPAALSWHVHSPINSSITDEFSGEPALCSNATEEMSDEDMQAQLNWDQGFHEESCQFLREKDMGETGRQQLVCNERVGKDAAAASGAGHAAHLTTDLNSLSTVEKIDNYDSSSLSSCQDDTEYRIDLVDFEPVGYEMEMAVGHASLEHEHLRLKKAKSVNDVTAAGRLEIKGGHERCCGMKALWLSLDYGDVISSWSDRGSLFADGSSSWTPFAPPDLDLAAWEPENQVSLTVQELDHVFPETSAVSKMIMISPAPEDGTCVGDDGDGLRGLSTARHARVLRYREKRQTRLFSKKIRYEVRKLNAERRPRMKGRFIKRSI